MKIKELVSECLTLPVDQRVLLVDSLLRSLNPSESEVDQKWIAATKRRLTELRSDQSAPIPGKQVFAKIRKRFPE